MAKFGRKKKKGVQAVNTASLPDIVFMLLFFFMVATVLRTEEEKVKVIRPSASEVEKIEKKHLIRYINIGPPMDKMRGTEPVIQLNDAFANVSDIQTWVANQREDFAEAEKTKMWVSLKVDKDTKMGIVTAVKQELRQASALKVLYSTTKRDRTASN